MEGLRNGCNKLKLKQYAIFKRNNMDEEMYSASEAFEQELERWENEEDTTFNSWIFDPLYPLILKNRIGKFGYYGLEGIFFLSILGLFYLSFVNEADSFTRNISVNLCSGMVVFYFAKLISAAIGKWRKNFVLLSVLLMSIFLGFVAYFQNDLLKDYSLNLCTDILLVYALDYTFKGLLGKMQSLAYAKK